MLWTVFASLLVIWLLGVLSGYTLGGWIHLCLVAAVIIVLIRLIRGTGEDYPGRAGSGPRKR